MSRKATPDDVLAGTAQWCVVCGERDDVLAKLADGAVDVTITDPPYDEHTQKNIKTTRGNWKKGGRQGKGKLIGIDLGFGSIDEFDIAKIAPAMLRVTKRWVLAFTALEQFGDWKRATGNAWVRAGVWDRVAPTPSLHGDRPACRVEGVALMHRPARLRWNGGGGFAFWQHIRLASAHGHARNGHPNEKPLPLMCELVRQFSDRNEVIGDWHAGSGSTGEAALIEGRRVILVERDEAWCEISRKRCEAAVAGRSWRNPEQMALLPR